MPFRSFDALRVLDAVIRCGTLSAAGTELHMSKGSVSYQIKKLETDVGFSLFERVRQRVVLTEKGRRFWHASQNLLRQFDNEIDTLRQDQQAQLTVGSLTYFFSRWLSSRLMHFMEANPHIAVRVEPIRDFQEIERLDLDVGIFWSADLRPNDHSVLIFNCPARPTANKQIAQQVQKMGLERALREIPLLSDSSGSTGWREWHRHAGIEYQPAQNRLIIPDSNDRVQAVMDGQGIALWDSLVQAELDSGELSYLSDTALESAGYHLVVTAPTPERTTVASVFAEWIAGQE